MAIEEKKEIIAWAKPLKASTSRIFQAAGVPQGNADIVADTLVEADLRGVHSHGVMRMTSYMTQMKQGVVNPRPEIRLVQERKSLALVDADNGHGQVASVRAMEIAIEKARVTGFAAVGVRRSSHFGAAAYFSMMALPYDMIGFSTTNTLPNTVLYGAAVGGVGNDPISYALPADKELPIVHDYAQSVVAHGKVHLLAAEGKKIPLGWGVDEKGNPTTDPAAVKALFPVGEHKGSGLAVVLEMLCGVLTGGPFCLEIRKEREAGRPWKIGHFFWALDIEGFLPVEEFKQHVDKYIREAKALPKAAGVEEIYMPGEIEFRRKAERLEKGIPLVQSTVAGLQKLGEELKVKIDLG